MGAPVGNDNSAKGKEWTLAIKRALARRGEGDYRVGLDSLAEKLLKAADADDHSALKAIEAVADRIEGKPTQSIEAEADVRMEIAWHDGGSESPDPVQTPPASD